RIAWICPSVAVSGDGRRPTTSPPTVETSTSRGLSRSSGKQALCLRERHANDPFATRSAPRKETPMRRDLSIAFVLLAVAFDLPPEARAQTCAANVPHVTGTWVTLPYQMPINPISATLMYTGKVLIVAGSENDAKNNSKGAESYRAAVWDP